MLVACCDHDFGNSTSRCSKTTSPFSLVITAERSSHSISSNGSTPSASFVKYRSNSSPGTLRPGPNVRAVFAEADSICCALCMAGLLVASRLSPLASLPLASRSLLLLSRLSSLVSRLSSLVSRLSSLVSRLSAPFGLFVQRLAGRLSVPVAERPEAACSLDETLGGLRLWLLRCRRTNMRLVYVVVKTNLRDIVSRSEALRQIWTIPSRQVLWFFHVPYFRRSAEGLSDVPPKP